MNFVLSNYEVRPFRKKDGTIWLYLNTHLVIETTVSFSMDAYLSDITGTINLPNAQSFGLVPSLTLSAAAKFDGHNQIHHLTLLSRTSLQVLQPCAGTLDIRCSFNFHGAETLGRHTHAVFVRRVSEPHQTRLRRSRKFS